MTGGMQDRVSGKAKPGFPLLRYGSKRSSGWLLRRMARFEACFAAPWEPVSSKETLPGTGVVFYGGEEMLYPYGSR